MDVANVYLLNVANSTISQILQALLVTNIKEHIDMFNELCVRYLKRSPDNPTVAIMATILTLQIQHPQLTASVMETGSNSALDLPEMPEELKNIMTEAARLVASEVAGEMPTQLDNDMIRDKLREMRCNYGN